jgi:hypothetical protein
MDYLYWRGDLSFAKDPMNEIDGLILALLSYLPFRDIIPGVSSNEDILLEKAAQRFLVKTQNADTKVENLSSTASASFDHSLALLLERAAGSPRFSNVRMSKYEENLDFVIGRQFGAITFGLNSPGHEKVIAFRGTDNSVIGWKEDFQLAYMEQIPAQEAACKYLERAISIFTGQFTICGHSKGGNLAVYAGSHVNPILQSRIARIINFDGPGFDFSVTKRRSFETSEKKVFNYIPTESMVGMLLDPVGKRNVIASQGRLMSQHNAFLWEVAQTTFMPGKLATVAKMTEQTLKTWLTDIPVPQREAFLEAFFEILGASEGAAIRFDPQENVKDLKNILIKYSKLDLKTKALLTKVSASLTNQTRKTLEKKIKEKLPKLI